MEEHKEEILDAFDIEEYLTKQFAMISHLQTGGFKHKTYEHSKSDKRVSPKRD